MALQLYHLHSSSIQITTKKSNDPFLYVLMPHHDVFYHHTPRQVNYLPSSLPDAVVSYDEPLLIDLPAIQFQLDALIVAADQENNFAEQEEAGVEQEDDDIALEPEDTEQDNPPAESGDDDDNDGAVVDHADSAETQELELD
ncbi:hypothetical protein EC957_011925 [Mortierella hygrophila]|uniref:Uncharacterized protein n=1 Tax=Mortierella hygrophila TaxID=979708 RepID=A0A9P6K3H0_9FUNG|nr:hypothetical protein EC957_011925 [Mortierella hygrophila]